MTLALLFSFVTSLAAPVDTSIHTKIEAQAIISDAGATPFWLRSLQYGSVPKENPGLILRAWNGKAYNLKKKYDWKYEVEATGWTGKLNDFWLTQAYLSGRRGKWELWAGRRKEVYGVGDTTMTGGFFAWSGNALPMPKIQLGTRDYINFAKGWLGVHMTFSHGWFDNQGPTIDAYLHQKTLYGRIGKPTSMFSLFGGINHNVSWGGEAKIKKGGAFDFYPSNFSTYFYVVTAIKDRTILATDPKSSWDDLGYQFGNHLGTVDLAIKIQTKDFESLLYRQSMYETGRIVSLAVINDGLTGFSIKLKKNFILNKIGLEYLYTGNQGNYISGLAQFFGLKDPHLSEVENYLNNGGRGSWKYWNMSLGTPIFLLDRDLLTGGGNNFTFNAIKSLHLNVSGVIADGYIWNARYSTSYYTNPRSNILPRLEPIDFRGQQAFSISVEKKISDRLLGNVQLGYDKGKMIQNSVGLSMRAAYLLR
jgi:hypothetical protein